MMYDGSVKMVQDIKVGDQLMGDTVTKKCIIFGKRGKTISNA